MFILVQHHQFQELNMDRVRIPRKPSPYQLSTESAEEHDDDSRGVTAALRPQNRLEEIYAADFVRANSYSKRMQRASSALIRKNLPDALFDILIRDLACEREEAVDLVDRWCRDDPPAKLQVKAILAGHRLAEHDIEGEALRRSLPELLVMEQLSASTGARRDKALAGFAFTREITARLDHEKAKSQSANQSIVSIETTKRKAG
jgi:hypothetical protein